MKKLFSTRYTETAASFSFLLLRFAAGGLMIPHGFEKLIHFEKNVTDFPDPLHLGNTVSLSLVIFAEFFCAILLVAGLMTRLALIPLLITMAVAVFIVHNGQVVGEAEHASLYLAAFTALLLTGPGKFSFDRMLGN